jgi:transcriptional regulator GlxA family with amidase domain
MKSTSLLIAFVLLASLATAQTESKTYKVAVFIYQGVELLDFAGPLEVFSNAPGFEVFTIAPKMETIVAMNKNIKFIPNYSISNCPAFDIIVFPGANMEGLMPVYSDSVTINWISKAYRKSILTMSVCTGAAFLSKAGILDGHTATTHWGAVSNLQALTPKAIVVDNKRFVQDGKLLTTAGVSAGLDGALHALSMLLGKDVAAKVAHDIEYDHWKPGSGLIVR